MTNRKYIPYNVYCDLLDYIGENYHNLKEETLVEDWWSDLTPPEQGKYMSDHPNSEKARTAREKEKEKEQGSDDTPSKSNTQAALKDLKTHVDSVSKSVGIDAKVVAKAFKEPSVYNTVNALGGSISVAAKTARGLVQGIGKSLNVGGAALTDTPGFDKLQKKLITYDQWLAKNPTAKKITGVALAGAAVAQWWYMSFSGDVESDFDLASVSAAITGKPADAVPTLKDFLGTPEGVKNMGLLSVGAAGASLVGTTSAYAALGSNPVGLGLALTYAGLKAAGETEKGKKVKAKMVAMGKEAKDKIQKGAKAVDKKLGIKKEEKMRFSSLYENTVLSKKVLVIEEDDDELDEGLKSAAKKVWGKAVNAIQRRKLARRMSRLARSAGFKMKKKRASIRRRSPEKIALIARKQSIKMFRDKFFPQYKDMPFQQRVKIDQRLMQKHGPRIDKIAKKKFLILKKGESSRIAKARDAMQGSTSDDD